MYQRTHHWIPLGFLLAGLIATLYVPRVIVGDDTHRLTALDQLLRHGRNRPTCYSLVGPLCSSPLWWLGEHLGPSPARWCGYFNLLLFAVALAVLNALLLGSVPDQVRLHFLLLLLFGSMFPNHLQHYGAEPFTALLVAIGIVLLGVHNSAWGWPCLVLATVNTPAVFGGLALVVAVQVLRTRRLSLVLILIATAGLFLLESWLRRGSLWKNGYETHTGFETLLPYSGQPGFSYPFYFGLLAILFSFGKGLLFFAPGLLSPCRADEIAPQARLTWKLWLVFLTGLILVYARWWAWYGGWTWGPRFFLFASIPAAFGLALALHEAPRRGLGWNLFALVALLLSFWVSYDGLVINQQNVEVCIADKFALEHLAWHTPEYSALWRPFVVKPYLIPRALPIGLLWIGCFVYLAYPLLRVSSRQLRDLLSEWWTVQSVRGPWRL